MQRERRQNPHPSDWQVTAAAGLAVLVTIPVLGLHLGRVLANLTSGAGLTLTARDEVFTALLGLARGDAAVGLAVVPETAVATPMSLWVWSAIVTLLLVALSVWAATWWWHRYGPGKVLGVATREEAEQLLGTSRLRKHRHVIRPDLHPRRPIRDALAAIATRTPDEQEQPPTREAQTW